MKTDAATGITFGFDPPEVLQGVSGQVATISVRCSTPPANPSEPLVGGCEIEALWITISKSLVDASQPALVDGNRNAYPPISSDDTSYYYEPIDGTTFLGNVGVKYQLSIEATAPGTVTVEVIRPDPEPKVTLQQSIEMTTNVAIYGVWFDLSTLPTDGTTMLRWTPVGLASIQLTWTPASAMTVARPGGGSAWSNGQTDVLTDMNIRALQLTVTDTVSMQLDGLSSHGDRVALMETLWVADLCLQARNGNPTAVLTPSATTTIEWAADASSPQPGQPWTQTSLTWDVSGAIQMEQNAALVQKGAVLAVDQDKGAGVALTVSGVPSEGMSPVTLTFTSTAPPPPPQPPPLPKDTQPHPPPAAVGAGPYQNWVTVTVVAGRGTPTACFPGSYPGGGQALVYTMPALTQQSPDDPAHWWLVSFGCIDDLQPGGDPALPMLWQHLGPAPLFGDITASDHRFWVGDFRGVGSDALLMYYAGDGHWWLGTPAVGQLTWSLVSQTGADGENWGDLTSGPLLVGDFTGSGRAEVLSYAPSQGTWRLGTLTPQSEAPSMTWTTLTSTQPFPTGAGSAWAGRFDGGCASALFVEANPSYLGAGHWWRGTVELPALSWVDLGVPAFPCDPTTSYIGPFWGPGSDQMLVCNPDFDPSGSGYDYLPVLYFPSDGTCYRLDLGMPFNTSPGGLMGNFLGNGTPQMCFLTGPAAPGTLTVEQVEVGALPLRLQGALHSGGDWQQPTMWVSPVAHGAGFDQFLLWDSGTSAWSLADLKTGQLRCAPLQLQRWQPG